MPPIDAVSVHEAGHAVASRILGIEVLVAAAGANPEVRTRFRTTDLEKVILVDLAGAAAELFQNDSTSAGHEWQKDETNALSRALRILLRKHGVAEVTDALRADAAELVESLRAPAAALVEENWPAIERLASRLAAGGVLGQSRIDALMAAARNDERLG
jgi:predicted pyridoxine 5'-phosphate oxidase superfamily flavin-nucleotide-binding protein